MALAQFEEIRDSCNNLIKMKGKLTGKKEINVTKAGDYVYLHINNLEGAYKSGKFALKDTKSVTLNMEDVAILKGLLTGIENKVEEMLAQGPALQTQMPGVQGGTQMPGLQGGTQMSGVQGGTQMPGLQGVTQMPGVQGGTQMPGLQGGTQMPGVQGGTMNGGSIQAGGAQMPMSYAQFQPPQWLNQDDYSALYTPIKQYPMMSQNNGRGRKRKAVEQPLAQQPPPKQQAVESYYSSEQWLGMDWLNGF